MDKKYFIGEQVRIIKPEEDYGCLAKVWEVKETDNKTFIKISYFNKKNEYVSRNLIKIVE